MSNEMIQDKREISAIFWQEGGECAVGRQGITRIECYGEPGQMAGVPWFKAWKGDFLSARYNGATLEGVTYSEEASTND